METQTTSRDLAGTVVLGRYRLARPVASGATGQVWLATDVGGDHDTSDRVVAVKLVDARYRKRAVAEAEVLAHLHHPNLVRLLDQGPAERGAYALVMAFVDGDSLANLMKGRGPWADVDGVRHALKIGAELCDGLAHAHAHGIVHGDVKAANVLVGETTRVTDRGGAGVEPELAAVVLVDFGIGRTESSPRTSLDDLTVGSVHTMAPEQVRNDPSDRRSDVYAVGVLLYRMLAGRYPFHSINPAIVLGAHLRAAPPAMGSVCPVLRLPPGVEDLIMGCLRKEPHERPLEAAALAAALREAGRADPESWVAPAGDEETLLVRPDEPSDFGALRRGPSRRRDPEVTETLRAPARRGNELLIGAAAFGLALGVGALLWYFAG